MSYIAPNGKIWLLHNVPLDKTYQDTMYWGSQADQTSYFIGANSSRVKYSFTNQYYTRHERGSIRVAVLADNVFDCNYLVFQNTSFSNKYFYAFITSVEYINNSVTQINFELDVIQTWYFDYRIMPCFLERMHAPSDARYSNLTPEPIEPGEYIYQVNVLETETQELYVIAAVVETTEAVADGKQYGNIYGGCTLYCFESDDADGINNLIARFIANPDSIVSIYMCPKWLITAVPVRGTGVKLEKTDVKTGTQNIVTGFPIVSTLTDFGDYTPHNNKLYSYPFCMLEVYTPEGTKANYRYEYFDDPNTPTFRAGGSITQPVELTIAPTKYKGLANFECLFTESLTLKGYPICSWNVDAYKAWVAQNSLPIAFGLGSSLAGSIGSIVTTPLVNMNKAATGIAANLVANVLDIMSQDYKASIQADQLHGTSNGSANVSMNAQGFFFAHKVINEECARRIDSFFDRFGYAYNRIEEPTRKTREFFTYIKTRGCVIHGGVPADDQERICQIHDNGVTYWDADETINAGYQIGNYSIADSNTPIA